jgi:hypothetical protein
MIKMLVLQAAESENMSPTKMSYNIKKKTIIDDFFYCTV